jgi:hypothetical protein
MNHRRLVVSAVLCGLAAMSSTVAAATRPYSVRNIAVGITLSEFRRLPHPDARTRNTAAQVYCSNEPGTGGLGGLALSATLLQAGAVKCAFYEKAQGADGEQLVAAPMTFLGEEVTPLFLFFKPEGAADYGLAQITFAMSNRRGGEIIELFYRAFGGATTIDIVGVSVGFGGDQPDIRYIWRNDQSGIQLDSLSFVLTEMSAVFLDNKLWGALSERLSTIERMTRLAGQEEVRLRAADEAKRASEAAPPAPASDDSAATQ